MSRANQNITLVVIVAQIQGVTLFESGYIMTRQIHSVRDGTNNHRTVALIDRLIRASFAAFRENIDWFQTFRPRPIQELWAGGGDYLLECNIENGTDM